MRRRFACGVVLAAALATAPPSLAETYQQAYSDWLAVTQGRLNWNQLTPERQQGVVAIIAMMRGSSSRNAPDGASSECRQAYQQAESERSDLESSTRRLHDCADNSNLRDDCDSELRRAKSDQEDFEDAVSALKRACSD